jgi:hypothetical protein
MTPPNHDGDPYGLDAQHLPEVDRRLLEIFELTKPPPRIGKIPSAVRKFIRDYSSLYEGRTIFVEHLGVLIVPKGEVDLRQFVRRCMLFAAMSGATQVGVEAARTLCIRFPWNCVLESPEFHERTVP